MQRRDEHCPLCGARLSIDQVFGCCEEVSDLAQGVVACHCPFCQGFFEVRASDAGLEIGYLRHGHFDTVGLLSATTGIQCRIDHDAVTFRHGERNWRFEA